MIYLVPLFVNRTNQRYIPADSASQAVARSFGADDTTAPTTQPR